MPGKANKCFHCSGRREFLKTGATLSVVALGTSALGLLSACGHSNSGVAAGPAVSVANRSDNTYALTFSQFAALQSAGGSVHISVAATSGTQDLFATRVSTTSAVAVSSVCTHAGCTLYAYDPKAEQYPCPCHSSIFDSSGAVVNGPADQALRNYVGTITGTGISFTIP